MLVDEFVEITVTRKNYKMLMDRGYEMPDEYKFINSKGNISLKFGFKILIYYFDSPESSSVKVRVKCDYPGCTDIHEVEYSCYTKYNHDGITYCLKHANPVFHSGEKHPLYNPNKEHDDIRKTPEYAITKLSVHERDKYTCVSCGKKIHDPIFHHLYSVNTHKELACKIDNAVTLCKKCHKDFHDIYGYGNNTPAQFIDYIKRELDWLEDYDKTKVEKKLVYCAELDETSTKSYFNKKLDIQSNGIYVTIDPNTGNKSVKGYHFISLQEKEKMKPEEFEKWKKNSLIEHENYSKIPKNKRLVWHKESNQTYIVKELIGKFGINNTSGIYKVCDRNLCSIYGQHFMWLEDYNEAIEDPKKMKEWEEWINSSKNEQYKKIQRLIWHKESNQFYTTEELVDKFGIKNIYDVYSVCDRERKHLYNNHYLWAEDYKKMTQEQMKEWENWITKKNERLVWHKESGEIKKAEDFLNTFGIKELRNIYNVCDRKQHSIRKQHFMWIEDYNEAIEDPKKMREWEEWILDKSERLIWHKESGEIKKAKDFKIDRIDRIYAVCERKLRSIYGQHFMWIEDYNEAIEDPKKMREWEEWAINKNERLIWHKETNQFYIAEQLVGKFGIKNINNVYSACDCKQKHAYNNHFLWAKDYEEMSNEQMIEWENWILSKTIRNTGGSECC